MITFKSNVHCLDNLSTQTKKWALTRISGEGSYFYHRIHSEYDYIEDLLYFLNDCNLDPSVVYDSIRHIDDMWFSFRKRKDGRYDITLRQE